MFYRKEKNPILRQRTTKNSTITILQVKLYLSVSGILSIFMGLAVSISLSSLLGFPYTPMHAALPFLCLGWNFTHNQPTNIADTERL